MAPLNQFLALFFFLFFTVTQSTWAQPLPTEPEEDYLVNEDVNIITGLYTRGIFVTTRRSGRLQNGSADHHLGIQRILEFRCDDEKISALLLD